METARPDNPDEFVVTVTDHAAEGAPPALVVRLRGELDIASVATLRTTLDDVLINGARRVVVDLTEVSFVDSSGLGALVGAHKKARVLKSTLRVVCAPGIVRRVIDITGLNHVLVLSDSIEAALSA